MNVSSVRKRLSGVAIILSVAVIAAFAVLYRGYPTVDVHLNDGGVWVTRSTDSLIGHLNYPSRLLDGATTASSSTFDLMQDGNDVAIYDSASGKLESVDPAAVVLKPGAAVAPGSRVGMRDGTLGLIDAATDGLYVLTSADMGGFTATGRDPLAALGPGSVVVTGVDGAVHAVSLKGDMVSVADPKSAPTTAQWGAFKERASLQITAVGAVPVVLDGVNGVVYVSGKAIDVPEAKAGVLQTASAANDEVLITTAAGLIHQPLDGAKATVDAVAEGGQPSQPVWVNGCGYAVWSLTGAYVRSCANQGDDRNQILPEAGGQPTLTLRQNRDVVVINELTQGIIWLPNDNLTRVDNWDDVKGQSEEGDKQSTQEQRSFQLPKRSPTNHRPVAKPDKFGVRAGSTAVLPVLDNDTDEDGDLLASSVASNLPAGVTVQPVSSGAALQVTIDANFSGNNASFQYQVDDGRENGTAKASVSLTISPAGENSPPKQDRVQTVQLEVGATANFDALVGWSDPERDDLYVMGADSAKGDRVIYRSNGMVQFTEGSGELGIHEVTLKVSDGHESVTGTLRVDVKAKGSLAPIANADRYNTTVGDSITIAPIANDLSTSGAELRLAKIDDKVDNVQTLPDFAANTFSFASGKAGTYYVQYLVAGGTKAADGIVRIDVHPKDGDELDPLATRDVALLMPSQQALVDVLANDTDPSGGILVVQSVTVPDGAPVTAEVLEHSVLRIGDAGLDEPVDLTYRVCSGVRCATGQVRVVPVGQTDTKAVPVALPDKSVVRVGDIVTVDVTANDYHPSGDSIELLPDLKEVPDAADGVAFVSEGKVRFRAADNAPDDRVEIVYEITDSKGHVTAGFLRVQVLPADAEQNEAPKPTSVTARTIAGTSVRIPIPLDAIDPDGDSVELVGVKTSPAKGRVTVGGSWLTYEAYADSAGSDSFQYQVRDRLGATGVGTVVVGVARQSNQNQAPYAVKDEVVVRPGRSVSVPVLTNDSDPDGDQVALVANGLTVPSGVVASVVKSRVLVEAPKAAGDYSITYTAVDDFGARATGTLVITVAADAPLKPPIARDDRVQPIQLAGGQAVDVPVLDNDEDPDGVAQQLTVTTDSPNATVSTTGVLKVTPTPKPQLIMYTVTDIDRQSTSAVVFVPGTDDMLPTVKTMAPLEVVAGKELRIALADVVLVRPDHTPRVAEADSVRASHSAGGALVADEHTLTYTAPATYYGPDAIGVRVTDGEGPDDPKANSAYLSIPIKVLPAENLPPTLKESKVALVPGETAVELNLAKLATDPNPEDVGHLTFGVPSVPTGLTASVEGDRLLVGADEGAEVGTAVDLQVEVADSRGAKGSGTVTALITRSLRGLPVAVDDEVAEAAQGVKTTVDVLRNDVNPFADEGRPLTVVSAKVTSGQGTATVSGDKLDVVPDEHFVGTMEIAYRIQDAVERTAEGTVRVTVQGAPSRVDKPLVLTVGNRTVVLQWTTPEHNGRPITGYTVTSKAAGFSQKCPTTTCTLKGLINDKEYTFQVVATNAIGDSEPSVPSAIARPDVRPDTPGAPTLEFGDKQLSITWKTPHSDGSPVLSYNLEISPAPETGAMQRTGVTGNRLVWSGLHNGTAYQVRVQAVNRAPEPSEWSQWSRDEVPAGKPDAPGQPTTSPATPVGNQAQIAVTWPAVTGEAANGDAVNPYTLRISHGGSTKEVTTTGTKQNIVVDPSTSDYTFSVKATNKAGDSPWSSASDPRRAAVAPDAPKSVRAEPGDHRVTLTFTAGEANGSKAGELTYHYKVNQTGADGTLKSGDAITGLTNGRAYTFDVWATSSVDGVKPGAHETSNSATPFGKPIISNLRAERGDHQVTFRWTVDDNGRDITSRDAPIGGTGDLTWTKTGLSDGESYTLSLRYTNDGGSDSASITAQANDPPPLSARVSKSGTSAQGQPGCNSSSCAYEQVTVANFPAGQHSYQCEDNHGGVWGLTDSRTFKVNFPANGTVRLVCYYGYPGEQIRVRIVGVTTTPEYTWPS